MSQIILPQFGQKVRPNHCNALISFSTMGSSAKVQQHFGAVMILWLEQTWHHGPPGWQVSSLMKDHGITGWISLHLLVLSLGYFVAWINCQDTICGLKFEDLQKETTTHKFGGMITSTKDWVQHLKVEQARRRQEMCYKMPWREGRYKGRGFCFCSLLLAKSYNTPPQCLRWSCRFSWNGEGKVRLRWWNKCINIIHHPTCLCVWF